MSDTTACCSCCGNRRVCDCYSHQSYQRRALEAARNQLSSTIVERDRLTTERDELRQASKEAENRCVDSALVDHNHELAHRLVEAERERDALRESLQTQTQMTGYAQADRREAQAECRRLDAELGSVKVERDAALLEAQCWKEHSGTRHDAAEDFRRERDELRETAQVLSLQCNQLSAALVHYAKSYPIDTSQARAAKILSDHDAAKDRQIAELADNLRQIDEFLAVRETAAKAGKYREALENVVTFEVSLWQAALEKRSKCPRCKGTGVYLAYRPTIYETDSDDEIEDSHRMAERRCPDCGNDPSAILSAYLRHEAGPLVEALDNARACLGGGDPDAAGSYIREALSAWRAAHPEPPEEGKERNAED